MISERISCVEHKQKSIIEGFFWGVVVLDWGVDWRKMHTVAFGSMFWFKKKKKSALSWPSNPNYFSEMFSFHPKISGSHSERLTRLLPEQETRRKQTSATQNSSLFFLGFLVLFLVKYSTHSPCRCVPLFCIHILAFCMCVQLWQLQLESKHTSRSSTQWAARCHMRDRSGALLGVDLTHRTAGLCSSEFCLHRCRRSSVSTGQT